MRNPLDMTLEIPDFDDGRQVGGGRTALEICMGAKQRFLQDSAIETRKGHKNTQSLDQN